MQSKSVSLNGHNLLHGIFVAEFFRSVLLWRSMQTWNGVGIVHRVHRAREKESERHEKEKKKTTKKEN